MRRISLWTSCRRAIPKLDPIKRAWKLTRRPIATFRPSKTSLPPSKSSSAHGHPHDLPSTHELHQSPRSPDRHAVLY